MTQNDEEYEFWNQTGWVHISALPWINSGTFDELLNLPGPWCISVPLVPSRTPGTIINCSIVPACQAPSFCPTKWGPVTGTRALQCSYCHPWAGLAWNCKFSHILVSHFKALLDRGLCQTCEITSLWSSIVTSITKQSWMKFKTILVLNFIL